MKKDNRNLAAKMMQKITGYNDKLATIFLNYDDQNSEYDIKTNLSLKYILL